MSVFTFLSIGAFILILLAILMACGTRFLTDLNSATFELGVGPNVFILDLNRFRYRIKLLPLLLFQAFVESPIRRSRSVLIYLFTLVGLVMVGLAFIGASLLLASQARDESPQDLPSASEAAKYGSFAVVRKVVPGSLAQRVGLTEGMIITKANGRVLRTGSDLLREYAQAKDVVNLEVLSKSGSESLRISIQKVKKSEPLGLVYVMPLQETKPIGQLAKVYGVVKAALYGAARAWWAIPSLKYDSVRSPAFDHLYWNPAILAAIAGAAFSMALYPLVYILLGNYEKFSSVVLILCFVRPGFWIWGILFGFLLIGVWKLRPAWLGFAALFCFVLLHFDAIFAGINVGIIAQIAEFERLALLWTA
jgi:hypothetical protein